MKGVLPALALVLPLCLPVFAGAGVVHQEEHPVGVPAPLFLLEGIEGGTYDLAQHLGRKPILLVFWSLFCVTCRDDIPALQYLADLWGETRLEFVGVNIDGKIPNQIRQEMDSKGYRFTSLMDEMSYGALAAADPYGVDSTPVVFLIDKRGWIAAAWDGRPDIALVQAALRKVME